MKQPKQTDTVAKRAPARRTTCLADEQLDFFRQLILEERAAVRDEISKLRRQIEEDRRRSADDLDHLHHISELDHDTQSVLLNRALRRWEALGDALDRIDDGTYGICKATGTPISMERLNAIPEAEYSYDAELDAEHEQAP